MSTLQSSALPTELSRDSINVGTTMGKLKTLGVILSVALAVLAYCLYTPMPPEAEEPFQQMKFLAKFKSIMGFVSLLDMVGLDGMDTFRKLRSAKPVVDSSDTVTVQ